jgi:hypothetical protein
MVEEGGKGEGRKCLALVRVRKEAEVRWKSLCGEDCVRVKSEDDAMEDDSRDTGRHVTSRDSSRDSSRDDPAISSRRKPQILSPSFISD